MANIIGKKVKHKSLGEGTITKFDGKYLLVSFADKKMEFIYPVSFKRFLSTKDKQFKEKIELDQKIAEKSAEEKKKRKEADIIALKAEMKARSSVHSNRYLKRDSVVFKCNDRDGEKCPMLAEWKASAGVVQTGVNKGTKKKLKRVAFNNLCILTTRDPADKGEDKRYIFAAFIIEKAFEGDAHTEGYVAAGADNKIELSQTEAHAMPFWEYHANEGQPARAFWGSGQYRYVSNTQAAQVLRDIAKIKKGTADEDLSKHMFEHFCRINQIDISHLPEPMGAIQLKAEQLSEEKSEDLIAQ